MLATTTLVASISSPGEGTPEGCLALRGKDAQARIRLATISAGRRPTVRVVAARSSPVVRSSPVAKIKPGRQDQARSNVNDVSKVVTKLLAFSLTSMVVQSSVPRSLRSV